MTKDEDSSGPSIPGARVLSTVKYGPGVVGRLAPVPLAIVGSGAVAAWALQSQPLYSLIAFLSSLAVGGLAHFGLIWFARKNPKEAVMDGPHIVQLEQVKQAAKDARIIEGKARVVGNTQAPKAITSQGETGE